MAERFSLLQELGLEPSAVRQPFGVLYGCVVTEPHVSATGEHSRLISELVTAAQLLRARMAHPRFPAFGGPLNISGYEIPARQKVLTQTLGTGPGIVVCGLALAAAALAAPVALMMPADRPMAEFQAGSKLMGAGIEKAPRSDQTVEGSSPATVKVTGLTPA